MERHPTAVARGSGGSEVVFMARWREYLDIGFLGAVGIAGWTAVGIFTLWPVELFRDWTVGWALLGCLAMACLARVLAVRVFRNVRIALDSAFYISAAFIFGVVPAAWLVLVVFTVDGLVRYLKGGGGMAPGETPALSVLAHLLASGGLPAIVLLGAGVVFGVDARYPAPPGEIAWVVPCFAVAFLALHYFVAGGEHWLQGTASRTLLREFFGRVVLAEMLLVPLAMAMVLGFQHQGLGSYLLLGLTCLTFNVIYRANVITSRKLERRVQELSTLDKVGRIISGSLERRTLLSNIASETLRLVRHTSRFMLGTVAPGSDTITYELFDDTGKSYRTMTAPRDEGLSGWVMAHREPLLLGDVRRQYKLYSKSETYKDPRFQSWLGVPLVTYDEVVGVMSVQSEQRDAYTADQLRVLTSIADQAAVALENARLYELATVDGLTGLLVRRHFDQRLEEEWSRSQRYGTYFSLGIFDLDRFKLLNDSYGHQVGDQVLRAAAAIVRRNMRAADLAGRYGGEEFAFILPRTRISEAVTVAERIRTDIEKLAIEHGGHRLTVTASMGLAGFPESSVASVSELIARADEAMYQAKRDGRNRVRTSPLESGGPDVPKPAPEAREQGAL
jgi:diguanylate cyclase (GGDEF)-like protein